MGAKKNGTKITLTDELRGEINARIAETTPSARLTALLAAIGVSSASWYRKPRTIDAATPTRPRGPQAKNIAGEKIDMVLGMAWQHPWYGYKRIAVMCRRCGSDVTDREAYRVMKKWKLLQQGKPREAEVYQAAKLFELLPTGPNRLWQMDVTYVHIAGYGWHYAVTVIDYYSRYLLAAYLTTSYSAAECEVALAKARAEAERLCGKLTGPVFLVTDNGSSFIAKRFAGFVREVGMSQVRIQYRTPQQLGLLERFHGTLKKEEIYWNLYQSPYEARISLERFRERYNMDRPHWALRPEGGGDPYVPYEVYALGKRTVLPKWQGWARAAKEKLDAMLGELNVAAVANG